MTTDVIIKRIQEFSLFQGIAGDKEKLTALASIMTPKNARAGTYLFTEGDEGDELYLLISGEVRVAKHTRQKEEYTITDLSAAANVFFGEMALMDAEKRSASIMLLQDSSFLVLNRADFIKLGDQHPEIGLPVTREINKILCERLRHVNDDVILLFDALVDEVQSNHL